MQYVICTHDGWDAFPYKRLVELLPHRERVYVVGRVEEADARRHRIEPLPVDELRRLDGSELTAIVASPYWLPDVLELRPRHLVALIEGCPAHEEKALWDKYSGFLAAKASLVGTPSEKMYLEQTFRREGVILLRGDSPLSYGVWLNGETMLLLHDYENVWVEALSAMIDGRSPERWIRAQWRLRLEYYRLLNEQIRQHETVCYLLACYLYLLDDPEAEDQLRTSFEQMVLKGHTDCLRSHFRFFSAMEAKRGALEKAVHTFGITALSEREKARYARMREWLQQERQDLVKADIYLQNEDYRSALEALATPDIPEAESLLVDMYIPVYRWEEALQVLKRGMGAVQDPVLIYTLEGTVHAIHNRFHDAIGSFLRAANRDWNAFNAIAELERLEQAIHALKGRLADDR